VPGLIDNHFSNKATDALITDDCTGFTFPNVLFKFSSNDLTLGSTAAPAEPSASNLARCGANKSLLVLP